MAGLPSCIETCKMSTPWPTPCWHATCHPSIVTKTWATLVFQLKSSVQNTSTNPATPQINPNYQYSCFICSISQDAYASLHPCVRSPFQQIRWGIPQSRRDGPCPQMDARWKWNETSKMMGAFLLNKTVEVFLHLLTSFVSCPGSSCWTWEASLFVLWKPCVNIRVLTFTVHQDVGATTNQFAVNAFLKGFLLSFVACNCRYQC